MTYVRKLWAITAVQKGVRSFIRVFMVTFLAGIFGLLSTLQSGNWSTARDALLALVLASVVAAVHAVEAAIRAKVSPPGPPSAVPTT